MDVVTVSLRQVCCNGRLLRRIELGFNTLSLIAVSQPSFTMCTGLAGHSAIHTFWLTRFNDMLLSSLGFPAK